MKNILNKIKQKANNSADIYIYGDIYDSWWDEETNSAISLKDKLLQLGEISEINLHINSLGGDVFEGIAMFNLLKQHQANVNVYIDGVAASIASVIAMAGDTIYMPKNSMMMIHNCWSYGCGNSKEFRKLADDLDKIMEASIESYMSKINISKDELKELLDNESWLTAQECLDMGFADELLPMSDDIEQSASKSIMDLVEENRRLKLNQSDKNRVEVIDLSKESIERIANQIVEALNKQDSTEQKTKIGVNQDSKTNVIESFLNTIIKNEREEN